MKYLWMLACASVFASSMAVAASGAVQIANPAAVFCVDSGGEHVIETETDGQRGYCILPDGSKVDAWEYFRDNWDKDVSGN